jgi:hypothetical protein
MARTVIQIAADPSYLTRFPANLVNFRAEARGCLELAKAETQSEVRTVLMGMALGWLKFANHSTRSNTLELEPEEATQ